MGDDKTKDEEKTRGATGMVIYCEEHRRPLQGTGYCPDCGFHPDMQSTYAVEEEG